MKMFNKKYTKSKIHISHLYLRHRHRAIDHDHLVRYKYNIFKYYYIDIAIYTYIDIRHNIQFNI